ncbi:hypothetical protein HY025_05905 [Candidatus Daviesbacteria bacterium]|nr:hypothetical protein [Candidatus Daviesbacteria bacterium]
MDQHRKEVEKMIVDAIILGLEKQQIQEKDLSRVADYVLANIDNIQNQEQMIKFVDEISLRWPIFENIREIERSMIKKTEEAEIAKQALNLIKSGKFHEAANLTTQVTN